MPTQSAQRFEHLASQQIDENGPGSILSDFEVLLGLVEDEVQTSGKYHLLPMARLAELDEMMAKPLRPRLKRPQQKSFPHLNGLYLLLRTTQLVIAQGQGKSSGRLTLDPHMHQHWLQLNATERYFNLLEAWLRHGVWEIVGLGRGSWRGHLVMNARDVWSSVPRDGIELSQKDRRLSTILYGAEDYCTLALLELFGLMNVERDEPAQGESWCITQIQHTAFGDELLQVAFEAINDELFSRQEKREYVRFGAWQPLLQPYFPQWVNNLEIAQPQMQKGVYYFKVSLGKPWRRIAISAESSLEDLATSIIRAFDFYGDHLYAFHLVARDGGRLSIEHPYVDEAAMHTDEVTIGELPLTERQSMQFQYDFGADWRFDVNLEKVDTDATEISDAKVVESHGDAPAEYEDADDDPW